MQNVDMWGIIKKLRKSAMLGTIIIGVFAFVGLTIMQLAHFDRLTFESIGGLFLILFCIAFGSTIGIIEVEETIKKKMGLK